MQVETRMKAEGVPFKHNETVVRAPKPTQSLTVKTHIKAGAPPVIGAVFNRDNF